MSSANRSALFTKIYKVLRKHYEPVTPPAERPVLEHLLYACVLEHAPHEAVDEVFARLQSSYFDWNEVRVTSVAELAEVMSVIPDSVEAAKRLKRALQSVFESHYTFDIDFLKKQGLAKTVETIEKYNGVTPFVVAYLTQCALGGHAIPINAAALAVLTVLNAVSEADAAKQRVPGLERAIAKSKGIEFASLLQQFSVDYAANPQSTKVKTIVGEIDPSARERLPKKTTKPAAPTSSERKSTVEKGNAESRPLKPGPSDQPVAPDKQPPLSKPEMADKGARKDRKADVKKPKPAAESDPKGKSSAARLTRKKPK